MQQRSLFSNPRPERKPEQAQGEQKPGAVPNAPVYTVTQLTTELKFLLESTYPSIWIEGEISNFSQPASGHFYFCLKDDASQIKAVMWRSAHRYMRWRPQNGMKVIVNGRPTVFGPRGEYQIEVNQIVPHGKGDLFAAFEQLKQKLQAEGLFRADRKRPIPLLPKKIGIVTSRTGAAIRDILNILNRRYMNLHILIYPATVQGDEAAPTIVEGIRALNRFPDIDVLIVARGGGSMEDLWPFNEEIVARAIVASRIPVISAVGHETDTTIADFAADLRAPTPSAAAELVIGKKSEFTKTLENLSRRIETNMHTLVLRWRNKLHLLAQHRAIAQLPNRVHFYQQSVDDYEMRVRTGLTRYYQTQTRHLHELQQKLHAGQLRHLIEVKKGMLQKFLARMDARVSSRVHEGHKQLARVAGKLDSLSPLAVLERGYSIACKEDGTILKDRAQVHPGEMVQLRLHQGRLKCEVKETEDE